MGKLNIYKRKDGRYEGRLYLGKGSDGRRKYKSYYGTSADEVKEKYRNGYSNNRFEPIVLTQMTVKDLALEWLSVISSHIKESTSANYRMKISKHLIPCFGDIVCYELRGKHIYAFIDHLLKKGLSARYISDIIVLLKSIFKYANREYNIKNIVSGIALPKKTMPEVRILTDKEQTILIKYLANNPCLTTLGICISLYTGLRIGELCALQWGDIDLEKRTLTVSKTIQRIQTDRGSKKTSLVITEPKSIKSRRVIPIPECLINMLVEHKAETEMYILTGKGKPIEPRTMQYRFAKVLSNVKLPSVHFHSLRHIFATRAISLGFDVKTLSELLGHSSIELTLNRYVHSSMEKKRMYMDMIKWSA